MMNGLQLHRGVEKFLVDTCIEAFQNFLLWFDLQSVIYTDNIESSSSSSQFSDRYIHMNTNPPTPSPSEFRMIVIWIVAMHPNEIATAQS